MGDEQTLEDHFQDKSLESILHFVNQDKSLESILYFVNQGKSLESILYFVLILKL